MSRFQINEDSEFHRLGDKTRELQDKDTAEVEYLKA